MCKTSDNGNPNQELCNLYKVWAAGGAGMLITGHMMIDRKNKSSHKDLVLDEKSNVEKFEKFAKACTENNMITIVQLNHPGRQATESSKTVGPSSVRLELPGILKFFSKVIFKVPHELTE